MDQVELFHKVGQKNLSAQMKDFTMVIGAASRMAFWADKKEWSKFFQDLKPKEKIGKKPKIVPRETMERLRRLSERIHAKRTTDSGAGNSA